MDDPDSGRVTPDDPGGGLDLTRRLAKVVPIGLVAGLAIGVPLAVALGEWRLGVIIPMSLAALAGTIAAAVEDGRVQRRVDRNARRRRYDGEN